MSAGPEPNSAGQLFACASSCSPGADMGGDVNSSTCKLPSPDPNNSPNDDSEPDCDACSCTAPSSSSDSNSQSGAKDPLSPAQPPFSIPGPGGAFHPFIGEEVTKVEFPPLGPLPPTGGPAASQGDQATSLDTDDLDIPPLPGSLCGVPTGYHSGTDIWFPLPPSA